MQKQLTLLCAKTCQSYLTKENAVLLSKCDRMIAHQFWPLVLSLQYKTILINYPTYSARLHPACKCCVSKRPWESSICYCRWHLASSPLCDRG